MPIRFIRPKEAARRSGYHVVTVRRKARGPEDAFPSLVDIGPNSQALVESEYEEWAENRIAERDSVDLSRKSSGYLSHLHCHRFKRERAFPA